MKRKPLTYYTPQARQQALEYKTLYSVEFEETALRIKSMITDALENNPAELTKLLTCLYLGVEFDDN